MSRFPTKVSWDLRRGSDGWHGFVTLGVDEDELPGVRGMRFHGHDHKDKAVALAKAAAAAGQVQALLLAHPELQAILPPGTPLALKVLTGVAKSALAGRLEEALEHHMSPAIRRLGKALRL